MTHLAGIMAANRRNYVPLEAATEAAAESFRPYTPPENLTWLDILRRNGLLRLDPDPEVKRTGPLEAPLDVVRFSFQRFQDHLMADALLSSVSDVEAAMAEGGSLAFIRTEARFRWEWRGLIEALSIQIPERTGREFVDTLPGGARRWWSTYFAQEAFLESLRWRSADAFTDRTLELFNRLFGNAPEALSLLIELSASIGHPWNADLIHKNLKSLPMHQRDAFWTAQLNMECNDEQHSVHRLIDWCLRPETVSADPRTIRLCALTTAWLFTLSNRPVRDQATKALARLLIGHPSILSELVQAFRGVDDLYVWERIFGAAFGAACNDPVPSRVGEYARIAAETLFLRADVPENLLLRDYGRGLVQLGEHLRVLTPDLAWERCHPPYGSRALRLTATRAQVEALAEKAGDKAILHSCDKWGDFGRYEIASGLGDFTADRLTRPAPITAHGHFNAFERDVVTVAGDRRMAWDGMRSVVASGFRIRLAGSTAPEPTPDEELRWQEAVRTAEQTFEALLTPDERRRYRRDARGYLGLGKSRGRRDHRRIDVERAQLWVARRAYELGRADKRFPWSQRSMAWDRGRPRVERLGKKYQWIALDELVCRLADNNWVSDYGDDAIRYEYPPDIGFFRDIDPTIVVQEPQASAPEWMTTPRIVVEPDQGDRLAWPFAADRESELERLIIRTETGGRRWLTAYEHQWASEPRNKTAEHSFEPYGRQEFRFVCLVLVHEGDHVNPSTAGSSAISSSRGRSAGAVARRSLTPP